MIPQIFTLVLHCAGYSLCCMTTVITGYVSLLCMFKSFYTLINLQYRYTLYVKFASISKLGGV